MKRLFFALCPLPATFLLISRFVPADTRATPPAERHAFDWLTLAVIGSPLLAFVGFMLIAANLSEEKPIRALALATAIAAWPTVLFLVLDFRHG